MRTNPEEVKDILGNNYDDINCPKLTPYIKAATLIVDRVNSCASDNGVTLTSSELREMERWLAAHFYTIYDPIYKVKTTANSSATYFDRSYLDAAEAIDNSGCLNAIMSKQRASLTWLGLPPSEQTDYVNRD